MKFNTHKTAAVFICRIVCRRFRARFGRRRLPALRAKPRPIHYARKSGANCRAKVGGGQATEVEFDRSRNKPDHFDVDVRTANGQKYEVEVNAKTGAVISSKLDD